MDNVNYEVRSAQNLVSRLARGRSYFAAREQPGRLELAYVIRSAEAAAIAIGESAAQGANPTRAPSVAIMAEVARDMPPSPLAASQPRPVSMAHRVQFAFSNMRNSNVTGIDCLHITHCALSNTLAHKS